MIGALPLPIGTLPLPAQPAMLKAVKIEITRTRVFCIKAAPKKHRITDDE
jgi:hypothetical protein